MARAVVEEIERDGVRYLVIGYSPPRHASFAKLTPSEFDVISEWAGGASMKAIAARRNTALRTVANQIARAYEKLGVASRAELLLAMRSDGDGDGDGGRA